MSIVAPHARQQSTLIVALLFFLLSRSINSLYSYKYMWLLLAAAFQLLALTFIEVIVLSTIKPANGWRWWTAQTLYVVIYSV